MQRIIAFFLMTVVKTFSHIFFRGHFTWLTPVPNDPFRPTRLMVFLNHTSLYEPLFLQALSVRELWHLTGHVNVPGADITLNRPIVGTFWKLLLPNISPISRRRDTSWGNYLHTIKRDSIILIAAEGRMKRLNGLDKFGKPMTVKGGVADIIEGLDSGAMIICLSGGLHHVQAPGQLFPRLFKHIHMNLAYMDIRDYKSQFPGSPRERKLSIVKDLQKRLEQDTPKMTSSKWKSSAHDGEDVLVKARDGGPQ